MNTIFLVRVIWNDARVEQRLSATAILTLLRASEECKMKMEGISRIIQHTTTKYTCRKEMNSEGRIQSCANKVKQHYVTWWCGVGIEF